MLSSATETTIGKILGHGLFQRTRSQFTGMLCVLKTRGFIDGTLREEIFAGFKFASWSSEKENSIFKTSVFLRIKF